MILRPAPALYSAEDQALLRDALRRADADNLKRGRDICLAGARLMLMAPGGALFALTVDDDGTLSSTPV